LWQVAIEGIWNLLLLFCPKDRAVWFVVEVPPDAPGGVYEGMVNIIGVSHSMERSPSKKSIKDWRLVINSGLLLMVNRS